MTATAASAPAHQGETGGTTVELSGLTKTYGSTTALDSVDMRVSAGQVSGVLGPNGAGKTTLLRAVLGLVRPDAGTARVLGHAPGSAAALQRTGAMIESPAFVPGLSGRRNLEILSRARGVATSEVDRVLGLVDLSGAAGSKVKTYSMGMKQRLGVGAAVLGSPSLLILDEPTNGLDPEGVVDMRALLRTLAQDGTTILISSHILSEVEQICDHVLVLQRGRVIADGTVADLTRGADETTELHVRAEPVARAEDVLAAAPFVASVTRRDGDGPPLLVCQVAAEDVPKVSDLLHHTGVTVYEISRHQRHLEDIFLALTHDKEES